MRQEQALYDASKRLAQEAGWVFVDNLPLLRALRDSVPLYNTFDYHIEPVASEVIGRREAEILAPLLRNSPANGSRAP